MPETVKSIDQPALTRRQVMLRDALYNLSPESGASPEYCRGLVVGLVAGMMATTGYEYATVIREVAANLPRDYYRDGLPEAFRTDIMQLRPPLLPLGGMALQLNDYRDLFTPDGKIHRVTFIERHPLHGQTGFTDFDLGGPFVRVHLKADLSDGYYIAYPSELILADEPAAQPTQEDEHGPGTTEQTDQ